MVSRVGEKVQSMAWFKQIKPCIGLCLWLGGFNVSVAAMTEAVVPSEGQKEAKQLSPTKLRGFSIPRSHSVELKDGERDYKLFIKLPRGYDAPKNAQRQYPVIYMTDAMYSFQIISGATRFPMNAGYMRHAILVGISWELGLKGDLSRVRDYTPSKDNRWTKTTGEAKRHLAFLRNQVIPYLDSHYRTDASQRTYVGNSLGGLFGAYILSQQLAQSSSSLFESFILGSPSMWFDNKRLLNQLAQQRTELGANRARVFIGIGELETPAGSGSRHDMVADAKALYRLLSDNRPEELTKLLIIPEAKHATAFPTTATQGLYWLYH